MCKLRSTYISPVTAHTIGLHVLAKVRIKRHAKTIITVLEDLAVDESGGVAIDAGLNLKWSVDANATKQTNIQIAAQ